MSVPTVSDVDTIGAIGDPVIRNLRITQCYHELALCIMQRKIEGFSLAGIGPGKQSDSFFIAKLFAYDFAGTVGRAVINDDDFEVLVVRREQASNRLSDHFVFVERRCDD